MAGGGDVIKQFLVALGFQTDEKSLGKFTAGVRSATKSAFVLGAAVTAAAGVVSAGMVRIAKEAEAMGYLAERSRASVRGLEEIGYVSEQLGISADAARQSVQGLGDFLQKIPGGERYLRSVGVATRDANGTLRDTVDVLFDLGQRVRTMPRWRQEAILGRAGVSADMLNVLTKDVAGLRDAFSQMYAVAGHDAEKAAHDSRGFLNELRSIKTMAGLLARAVTQSLTGSMRKDAERIRRVFMENFKAIAAVLSTVISLIMRVATFFGRLVFRGIGLLGKLLAWFNRLDPTIQKIITGIVAFAAAWKLLNLGFLASPLGLIIGSLIAIVALVDDFFTYVEGGKSLLDWGPFAATLERIAAIFNHLWDAAVHFGDAIWKLFTGDFSGALDSASAMLSAWGSAFREYFAGIADAIRYIFNGVWPSVEANFPDFAAWAADAAASIKQFLGGALQSIRDKINGLVEFLPDWVKEKLGLTVSVDSDGDSPDDPATGTTSESPPTAAQSAAAREAVSGAARYVKEAVGGLADYLPDWIKEKLDLHATIDADGAGAAIFGDVFALVSRASQTAAAMQGAALTPGPAGQAQLAANHTVTIEQKTEIIVDGAQDPAATGASVAREQRGVNSDMQRNFQGAIR